MKIAPTLLTLAIGLTAGFGLGVAIPVLASQGVRTLYTQETVTAGDHLVTVLTDMRRDTVCYITDSKYSGSAPVAISCVK